jgi:hypothetical protein
MTVVDFWLEEKAIAPSTAQKTPCCHCEAAGKRVNLLVLSSKQPKQSQTLAADKRKKAIATKD